MTRTIAVMMFKGGAGKSTTATNLGAAMALSGARGKRVLLVDLDWQGNATSGVGFNLRDLPGSINDLFADPSRDPATVIQSTDFGLDVLPASPALATTAMNMQPTQMFLLREILGRLGDRYDVILIDTPPGAGYMTYNAQAAATDVLIPVAARGFSEEGLAATMASVRAVPWLCIEPLASIMTAQRTLVTEWPVLRFKMSCSMREAPAYPPARLERTGSACDHPAASSASKALLVKSRTCPPSR